jgi:3-methyladenine DNA glycosylase Tag
MTRTLIVTISVLATMSAFAQGQMNNPATKIAKPTKADIQTIVQAIIRDKAKIQAHCDLAKFYEQMAAADAKKDMTTLESLSAKAAALNSKLGPDYAKLVDASDQADPDSSEGKEIAASFEMLDKQCK